MPKPKILTNAQARELKWFCDNVTGVRQDYYKVVEVAGKFDERLKRLEKTCDLIEKHLRNAEVETSLTTETIKEVGKDL